MSFRSAGTRCAVAAVLICGLATLPAHAADRSGGLVPVGPVVQPVRVVGGSASPTVVVRNESGRTARLGVRFLPAAGGEVVDLSSASATGAPLSLEDARTARQPLPPGAERALKLRVQLDPEQAPEQVSGDLAVRLAGGDELTIRLDGRPPDISFDPPSVTVDVTQGCWILAGRCGDSTTVLVRGKDAVAWARQPGGPPGSAILHNEDGGSVVVRMGRPVVRDGAVQVRIDADGLSEAGRYSGRLPLDAAGVAGPSLGVVTNVRWSLAIAVLVVFSGALFGGFFLRRFEIRRRRKLLELALLSAVHRYDELRGAAEDRVYGFKLDRELEPRHIDHEETVPFPGTRGVSALLWYIRTASEDEDFAEETARVHTLISAIERWLKLEPVAKEAALLLEAPAPQRGKADFSDCQAHRDLAWLLVNAGTPPADDSCCESLVRALADQGLLVSRCKVLWTLLATLEGRSGWTVEQAQAIHGADLVALEQRYKPFRERAAEQTGELRVEVDGAIQRLRRLEGAAATATFAPLDGTDDIEQTFIATRAKPNIERSAPETGPWELRLRAAFSALTVRSVLWTLARALVAVAAYALTIYSDTWGSVTDFASAFTAGFLTETLVNWALLPAFRGVRNRMPAPAGDPEQSAVAVSPADTSAAALGNGHATARSMTRRST